MREVSSDRKRNIFLIAEKDGRMVGFLIAHILPDKDFFLNDIYVMPKYRMQGIGKLLLSEFERLARRSGSKFRMGFVLTENKKMRWRWDFRFTMSIEPTQCCETHIHVSGGRLTFRLTPALLSNKYINFIYLS